MRLVALIALATGLAGFAGLAQAQSADAPTSAGASVTPKAVVELYTSQGCSSCPAADALLNRLAERDDIIAVSLAVDYWDYLGWKDTLAQSKFSERQKAFAKAIGDGMVYTPQVVVNGSVHALGSDKSAIEQAILKTRKNGAMSLPPVTLTLVDGKLNVTVPDVAGGETGGEVWLFGLVKAATIVIGRGENKGRTVTYHNVVRRWIKLGDWSGKANAWSVPVQKLKGDSGIDEAAVLVQGGTAEKPKAILGGTLAAIH